MKIIKFHLLNLIIFLTLPLIIVTVRATPNIENYEYRNSLYSLEKAKELFFNYHHDLNNIDRTIKILEKVLEKYPDNFEANILLSRALLTCGHIIKTNKIKRIEIFSKGKDAAERAIKLDPNNPDAHLFYVTNLSSLGYTKGILNSLFMIPKVRRELDLILKLDPNHVHGLAMNGTFFMYAPSLLGGDIQLSELYLKRAIQLNPHFTTGKLYLGLNLKKQNRYGDAIQILTEILNEKEPDFYPDWYFNKKFASGIISNINKIQENK